MRHLVVSSVFHDCNWFNAESEYYPLRWYKIPKIGIQLNRIDIHCVINKISCIFISWVTERYTDDDEMGWLWQGWSGELWIFNYTMPKCIGEWTYIVNEYQLWSMARSEPVRMRVCVCVCVYERAFRKTFISGTMRLLYTYCWTRCRWTNERTNGTEWNVESGCDRILFPTLKWV